MFQMGLTVVILGLLLVGYVVFVIRRGQRRREGNAPTSAPTATPTAAPGNAPSSRASADPRIRSDGTRMTKKELAARPDSEVFAPVEARLPKALQGQVPQGEGAPPQAPPPPSAGLASPAPTDAPEATAPPPPAAPTPPPPPAEPILPRLAAGISLPCDLGPLVDIAPRSTAIERVAFITNAFPGEVVQRELESAFEGLGGHISWFGPDVGVLRRDGLEANLALYTAPQSVKLDGLDAFPTAPLGSVVVDLWVDGDPQH